MWSEGEGADRREGDCAGRRWGRTAVEMGEGHLAGAGISALRWSGGKALFFDANGLCRESAELRLLKPLHEPGLDGGNSADGATARWLRFQARATRTQRRIEDTVAVEEAEASDVRAEEPSSAPPEYSQSE
jgi:hypothetical protein